MQKKLLIGLLGLTISVSGFSRITDNEKDKAPKKDSASAKQDETLENMGFKNLFTSDNFNPTQPYVNQINPMAVAFVDDYIRKQGKALEEMKSWGQPYFRMMDGILASYGIPKEMKYLAVIESQLKSYALSWVGAVGPWQFMPETGRRMGLVVNNRIDERTNYYKSTHAAARYLKELYGQLGDWLLVIAAYNGGPGRVFSAMRRSGSSNFWELQNYLPTESRNHVKKFIGTHYIMEGSGGLTTSTTEEWAKHQQNMMENATQLQAQAQISPEVLATLEEQQIQGKYNGLVLCNKLLIDINEFNKWNPNFDNVVAQAGYKLRLPKKHMTLFNMSKYVILQESVMSAINNGNVTSAETFPEVKPTAALPVKRKR